MVDKILIPAEISDGKIVVISVVDADGSTISVSEEDVIVLPPGLDEAFQAINAFSVRLRTEIEGAAPDRAKVEFSIGFAMHDARITPIVMDDKSTGAITVTLEWDKETQKIE